MILSVQNICKTYLDYESNFKRFASWFSKNKEEKNVKSSTRYENKRDRIVEFAKKQIGKPYFYGASGSDMFDCSSFVQYVFKTAANINLPRVSYQQAEFKPKSRKYRRHLDKIPHANEQRLKQRGHLLATSYFCLHFKAGR